MIEIHCSTIETKWYKEKVTQITEALEEETVTQVDHVPFAHRFLLQEVLYASLLAQFVQNLSCQKEFSPIQFFGTIFDLDICKRFGFQSQSQHTRVFIRIIGPNSQFK